MTYALVRHGQTDWNLEGRMQGVSDVPLNDTGRGQVRTAAELLADEHWDAVVSSPLVRARETGAIIAERLGLELGPAFAEFGEQDFGVAEGLFVHEIADRWPDWRMPGKEDDLEVGPRGIRGLELVRAEYGDADVIIAAHGTLIRYTLATLQGVHYDALPDLENGARSSLRFDEDSWRVLTVGGVEVGVEFEVEA